MKQKRERKISNAVLAMQREVTPYPANALPVGTRVKKVQHPRYSDGRPLPGGDLIPLGTKGTITGAMPHPSDPARHGIGYFLRWDAAPYLEAFANEAMIVPLIRVN